MIRKGDRVCLNETIATVCDIDRRKGLVFAGDFAATPDEVELLCMFSGCERPAERFGVLTGNAYCGTCATIVNQERLQDVRPDPIALASCVCGESLDFAKSDGVWTMADVACEYRTCSHCRSTRAYMPADVVRLRRVHLYNDPNTSEISGEWDGLLDALDTAPTVPHAELRRNGVCIARAFTASNGSYGWRVMPPQKETPCAI